MRGFSLESRISYTTYKYIIGFIILKRIDIFIKKKKKKKIKIKIKIKLFIIIRHIKTYLKNKLETVK